MKLSENQYKEFKNILDNSTVLTPTDQEYQDRKKELPGVFKHETFVLSKAEKSFSSIKHYSMDNPELVKFVTELAGNPKGRLFSLHQGYYGEGTYNRPHLDDATWTLVIMVDSDLRKGGDFYLVNEFIPEFKDPGSYVMYDGSRKKHSVTTIEEGWREVLVVWWKDEEEWIERQTKVTSLI
jgi:hypothetical protein